MGRPPHLVHFRISHYNEKVRWALDFKGIAHTREARVPGFHVLRAYALSGQRRLPILELEGRVLVDSTRILAALEERYPEPALFPRDATSRERALALEEHFDDRVAPALRRLFWAAYLGEPSACVSMATAGASAWTRRAFAATLPLWQPAFRRNMGITPQRLERARDRLHESLDRIVAELGGRPYLVGEVFSVADLSVAAVMTAILRPPEFPYPLPEPWPQELRALRAGVVEHPGAQWVLETYRRHRGLRDCRRANRDASAPSVARRRWRGRGASVRGRWGRATRVDLVRIPPTRATWHPRGPYVSRRVLTRPIGVLAALGFAAVLVAARAGPSECTVMWLGGWPVTVADVEWARRRTAGRAC